LQVRAEINELIFQLEAANPTPNPTDDLNKMNGNWRLVYTNNTQLLAVMAMERLPGVVIGEITQKIDTIGGRVENNVQVQAPFSKTTFGTSAQYEIRSPKRMMVKYEKGTIQTPELLFNIDLPDQIDVLGQKVDLAPLSPILTPLEGVLTEAIKAGNGLINRLPKTTDVQIKSDSAQSWLITTYLDEDTRIARGDAGAVFVFSKEYAMDNTEVTYGSVLESVDDDTVNTTVEDSMDQVVVVDDDDKSEGSTTASA